MLNFADIWRTVVLVSHFDYILQLQAGITGGSPSEVSKIPEPVSTNPVLVDRVCLLSCSLVPDGRFFSLHRYKVLGLLRVQEIPVLGFWMTCSEITHYRL